MSFQYEEWMEEGKRNVVKNALSLVEKNGLPFSHHFYITFRTDFSGVHLPVALRSLYPEEMSILVKESFWDLRVTEDYFSIELLFDDNRSALRVPFKALISFIDPEVEFGLQFEWEKNLPSSEENNIIFLDNFRKTKT